MIRRIHELDGAADEGRDPELESALSALDPASRDPNYWFRFRWWVLNGAGMELARRRREVRLTVGDVLESWARALVPTAALVAALAGLLLVHEDAPAEWHPAVAEEVLLSEVEGNPVQIDPTALTFAAEVF
ncbi:MAG: hypothetical protein PVJ80_06090 [Gemmatimonadota bacterium]|jgi:hypothetical protein